MFMKKFLKYIPFFHKFYNISNFMKFIGFET